MRLIVSMVLELNVVVWWCRLVITSVIVPRLQRANCAACRLYLVITDTYVIFFFSSRRRHTRSLCDWSSDVFFQEEFGIQDRCVTGVQACALPYKIELRAPCA